jgi:hypothetical protein
MQTVQNSRSALDQSLLSEDCPTRNKFFITIQPDDSDGSLLITLVVPLSSSSPAENEAKQLFCATGDDSFTVQYKPNVDLKAEMKALLMSLTDMYKSPVGGVLRQDNLRHLTNDELFEAVNPIVEQGRNVFHRLFVDIDPVNYSSEDKEIARVAIISALSKPQIIAISTHVPLFPWAFLFSDPTFKPDDRSTINPLSFWGFKHEIQEELNGTARRIHLPSKPKIVASICAQVDTSNWHTHSEHSFVKMASEVTPAPSVKDLGEALGNFESDCLYFFGHAFHLDPPVQSKSWLKLNGIELTVSHLIVDYNAPRFKNRIVIAFLNGCRTAPLTVWNENTVAGFLCLQGDNRVCCVASVGEIPPAFAADFAKHFWEQFLIQKQPIGRALLNARLAVFNYWNNPLGLFYSLFGRVDTQLH